MQREDGEFNELGQRIPVNPFNPHISDLEPDVVLPDLSIDTHIVSPIVEERYEAWPEDGPDQPYDPNQGPRVQLIGPPHVAQANAPAQAPVPQGGDGQRPARGRLPQVGDGQRPARGRVPQVGDGQRPARGQVPQVGDGQRPARGRVPQGGDGQEPAV